MANGSAGLVLDEKNATKGVAVDGGWQDYRGYLNIRSYCDIGIFLALLVGYELDLGLQGIWGIIICGIAMKIAILISITNLTKWNRQEKTETANLGTNESYEAKQLPNSKQRQKVDVFLSHSGKQKIFVRQLHRDLTNQGVSCFFDEDSESLPVGEDFPPRIFEAAQTCKLAVLLLSKDFLESKWPMLEASAFVKARDTNNPNLQNLPLFFMIPPEALKEFVMDKEKWKGIEKSEERRVEWQKALKAIGKIKGLMFNEGGNEVEFREKIRKEIWRKLPTQLPRYHATFMQGEERMCQEVANFVKTIHPNEKGIRIAGLYGIAGHRKITLARALCNFKVADFEEALPSKAYPVPQRPNYLGNYETPELIPYSDQQQDSTSAQQIYLAIMRYQIHAVQFSVICNLIWPRQQINLAIMTFQILLFHAGTVTCIVFRDMQHYLANQFGNHDIPDSFFSRCQRYWVWATKLFGNHNILDSLQSYLAETTNQFGEIPHSFYSHWRLYCEIFYLDQQLFCEIISYCCFLLILIGHNVIGTLIFLIQAGKVIRSFPIIWYSQIFLIQTGNPFLLRQEINLAIMISQVFFIHAGNVMRL